MSLLMQDMILKAIICILDELSGHVALIPHRTMVKENCRKWKSDDHKVMKWDYYDKDDYFDPYSVRFNFNAYRKRTNKNGFIRTFKEYVAEKYDVDKKII